MLGYGGICNDIMGYAGICWDMLRCVRICYRWDVLGCGGTWWDMGGGSARGENALHMLCKGFFSTFA